MRLAVVRKRRRKFRERNGTKLRESERGGDISKKTKQRSKCNLYKTFYGHTFLDNRNFAVTRRIP